MTSLRTGSLLLVLLLTPATFAQERTHAITPEDYAQLSSVTDFAVSPDGKQVVYCLATWNTTEDNRRTDLWLLNTDGSGKPTRLTFDRGGDHKPSWSPDGKTIYFAGKRKRASETKAPYDGSTQVWQIAVNGGEPRAVTREAGGIILHDHAPTAEAIYFTKDSDHNDQDDFSKLRQQYAQVEYGHGKRRISQVYRLDLNSWQTEKVIDARRYVRELAVTADGKKVGMITAPDDTVIRSEGDARVEVWDAETKKTTVTDQSWKKTAASPWPWLESLAWDAAGTRLAYCTIFDAHPTEIIVCTAEGNKWPATRVKRLPGQHVHGYGSPLRWSQAGLIYLGEKAGEVPPVVYNPTTEQTAPAPAAWAGKVVYGIETAAGKVIALAADAQGFAELVAFEPGAERLRRLTTLNPQTKTWKLPSVRHITWKAADGAEVGGVLELPEGYIKGNPLPLVVAIHGGPTTSTKADLSFDPHNGRLYFAAKGYAVLLPNYRGSTGYGDKFVTDLIGNENDIEVKDILAGVQHLIKEGIADPERLAVMGWSNGGYLTNCLIALQDSPVKFRAASSGAGILDTVAEWGFNDEPAYPMVFKKGLPWEQPEIYRKTSPTYGLGNVTTPTLIHVGGNDERCPPGHSRMLYRALKEYRKVPTNLVVYTGEPHGLSKLSNRTAKMAWDLAWFEKYLKTSSR